MLYETRALEVLALASKGRIGRARSFLDKCMRAGDLTFNGALSMCECGRGGHIAECWRAALQGHLDEARELSQVIGGDADARARAMQAFLEAFFRRCVSNGKLSALATPLAVCDIQDDAWQSIQFEWDRLAKAQGQSVLSGAREMIRFWSRVTGLQDWNFLFRYFVPASTGRLSTPWSWRLILTISTT